ncbi:hypothetical protein EMCRGX_G011201 [Ephydatia muelleri]
MKTVADLRMLINGYKKDVSEDGSLLAPDVTNGLVLYINSNLKNAKPVEIARIVAKLAPRQDVNINALCASIKRVLQTINDMKKHLDRAWEDVVCFLKLKFDLPLNESVTKKQNPHASASVVMHTSQSGSSGSITLNSTSGCTKLLKEQLIPELSPNQSNTFGELFPAAMLVEERSVANDLLAEADAMIYDLQNQLIFVRQELTEAHETLASQYCNKGGTTDIDNSDSTEANLRVLYPLDRFGVSDKFYQELSMLFSELPRSNAVKKTRTELNDILDLIRIEGYEADSFVNVNGNPYSIELFLSSDMKVGVV